MNEDENSEDVEFVNEEEVQEEDNQNITCIIEFQSIHQSKFLKISTNILHLKVYLCLTKIIRV